MTNKEMKKYLKEKYSKKNMISTGFMNYVCKDEVWVPCKIQNHKTREYISSLGRVYSMNKDSLSSISESYDHYLRVLVHEIQDDGSVKSKNTNVHRLMLYSFKGNPSKDMIKPECDHINNNTLDNSIDNLRWISAKDNLLRRENYKMLTDEEILAIADEIVKNELSPTELVIKFNTNKDQIYTIIHKDRRQDILKNYDFSKYDKYTLAPPYIIPDDIKKEMEKMIKAGKPNAYIKRELNLPNIPPVKDALVYMRRNLGIRVPQEREHFTVEEKALVDKYIIEGLLPSEICKKLNKEYSRLLKTAIYGRKQVLIKNGKLSK